MELNDEGGVCGGVNIYCCREVVELNDEGDVCAEV